MSESTHHLPNFKRLRDQMVKQQLAGRDIRSSAVLDAMAAVPRERFVPARLAEFAYEDSPLPIGEDQTISQPYVVALMVQALGLESGERVLEVGAGSGYAAAVLGEIAERVYAMELVEPLCERARGVLNELGYANVEIIQGDGSVGYPEGAPYDAILVSAGGPEVPGSLKRQLKIGGRLLIPVGKRGHQSLRCVTREEDGSYQEEVLGLVHFVPLLGREGWAGGASAAGPDSRAGASPPGTKSGSDMSGQAVANEKEAFTEDLIAAAAEPISDLESADLSKLLERVGDARVVLLGEASHGTSEFYRFRARLTQELIERKGFTMVAVEADWPDAARIDHYVRHLTTPPSEWRAFSRFPEWMWRNTDVQEFVEWLRRYNAGFVHAEERVGFYGLDLYSMYSSIDEVLKYLEGVDPESAAVARERYGCLTPWQSDPATYGRAVLSGRYRQCQPEVVRMLVDLMDRQMEYAASDGTAFWDAVQNARLVANAEEYYRSMYEGYANSWNLRDSHMFETICSLLDFGGEQGKLIVWEHNSHIGNARATDMAARGQHNVGQLCREKFGDDVYLVGFGTHSGTVAAADDWDAPMRVKRVVPSLGGSWERLCHDAKIPAFILPLKQLRSRELRRRLEEERPQRAIGVIYRPESEWASHYFHARLGEQFDEYVWFDETSAVTPLGAAHLEGTPDTYPFGL